MIEKIKGVGFFDDDGKFHPTKEYKEYLEKMKALKKKKGKKCEE